MIRPLAFLLFILFLLKVQPARGQSFNDSLHYRVRLSATGVINRTEKASSYLLSNGLKLGTRHKRLETNASANYVYGKQDSQLSNNDFNSTLDFNFHSRLPRFYYWGLGSFEKSYSLKVINRTQAGGGVAYSFLDRGDSLFLNVSDGLLYEYSSLEQPANSSESFHSIIRNSLRLRMRYRWRQWLTFESAGFLQNSLQNSGDYLIRSSTSLGIQVRKGITLTSAFTYNKVSLTRRENVLLTFGITLDQWF